jgi:hypothetical protein
MRQTDSVTRRQPDLLPAGVAKRRLLLDGWADPSPARYEHPAVPKIQQPLVGPLL